MNGGPSVVITVADAVERTLSASIADGKIVAIYVVANPDKLARLLH